MIFSDFVYPKNTAYEVTFSRFVRGSGIQASVVTGNRISVRSTVDANTGTSGVQRYIDQYGDRLFQISGSVKGTSETDLYNKLASITAAFDIKNLESTSFPYGFAPLEWTDPGQATTRSYVKPLRGTLSITEERTGLARKFSILLQAKDPVIYRTDASSYVLTFATGGGGSVFPFVFPVVFGSQTGSVSTTINNAGSSAVYPESIILTGPPTGSWSGAIIANDTTGQMIQLNNTVSISTGQTITITPSIGRILLTASGNTTDISGQVTTSNTFWQFSPGNNTIRLGGNSTSAGASATISLIPSV